MISRGQISFGNLSPTHGRAPAGRRPVLVVSADASTRQPLVVTVVVGTDAKTVPRDYPTNVRMTAAETGLPRDTVFLCLHIRSLDPARFFAPKTHRPTLAGAVPPTRMAEVEQALRLALTLSALPPLSEPPDARTHVRLDARRARLPAGLPACQLPGVPAEVSSLRARVPSSACPGDPVRVCARPDGPDRHRNSSHSAFAIPHWIHSAFRMQVVPSYPRTFVRRSPKGGIHFALVVSHGPGACHRSLWPTVLQGAFHITREVLVDAYVQDCNPILLREEEIREEVPSILGPELTNPHPFQRTGFGFACQGIVDKTLDLVVDFRLKRRGRAALRLEEAGDCPDSPLRRLGNHGWATSPRPTRRARTNRPGSPRSPPALPR